MGEKARVVLVGALASPVGGIRAFMEQILNSKLKERYELIPFNTARPLKNQVSGLRGYMSLFNAGIMRACLGVAVTLTNLFKFPLVLLKKRPRIVHINTSSYWVFWESAAYVLLSKMAGCRVILHVHGSESKRFCDKSGILRPLITLVFNRTDVVVALSESWRQYLSGFACVNIKVVPNPVNTSIFNLKAQEKGDKIRALLLGSDWRRKGVYDVFKAAPLIVGKDKRMVFMLAGEEHAEKYKNACTKGDMTKHFEFLGIIEGEAKTKALTNADMFILPSYNEGLPIAMLEAMAAGLPVVSTRVGAIPEVIEEGVNGFLIEPGDFNTLADRVIKLAGDGRLRRSMGERNRMKARQYDINSVADLLDEIYQSLESR